MFVFNLREGQCIIFNLFLWTFISGSSGSNNHCDCSSFVNSSKCWCHCSYSGGWGSWARQPWWTHANRWSLSSVSHTTGISMRHVSIIIRHTLKGFRINWFTCSAPLFVVKDHVTLLCFENIVFFSIDFWRGRERGWWQWWWHWRTRCWSKRF